MCFIFGIKLQLIGLLTFCRGYDERSYEDYDDFSSLEVQQNIQANFRRG